MSFPAFRFHGKLFADASMPLPPQAKHHDKVDPHTHTHAHAMSCYATHPNINGKRWRRNRPLNETAATMFTRAALQTIETTVER